MLVLYLAQETLIRVGRVGDFLFPVGWYLYAGSALHGLDGRVRRHAQGDKRLRWHIDYLSQRALVKEAWMAESAERWECAWAQAARGLPGSAIPVVGFGASDCRCPSHLFHFRAQPSQVLFAAALAQRGITVPLCRWVFPGQEP